MDATPRGPIEDRQWPDKLQAHVVDLGDEHGSGPRILGYAVEHDLARNYGFCELVLLAATGELPCSGAARALEVALAFLAASSVAEAPVHAACLARLSGAEPTGVAGVAAIALAEQARFVVDECRRAVRAPVTHSERESVARLRAALEEIPFHVPALDDDIGRTAALLAVLERAGLRTPDQVALAFILARLPIALAESNHVQPGALREYPMNTPAFEYDPNGAPP